MSQVALRQLAAVAAYKQAHPEIDWARNVVLLRNGGDGWVGIGHRPGNHLFERVNVPK